MKRIARICFFTAAAVTVLLTVSCSSSDRSQTPPPPPSEIGRYQIVVASTGQQSLFLLLIDTKEGKSWTYVPPVGTAVNGFWTDIPRVEHPQEFWRQALEQMTPVTSVTNVPAGAAATPPMN
jgi:hypothetical protein